MGYWGLGAFAACWRWGVGLGCGEDRWSMVILPFMFVSVLVRRLEEWGGGGGKRQDVGIRFSVVYVNIFSIFLVLFFSCFLVDVSYVFVSVIEQLLAL